MDKQFDRIREKLRFFSPILFFGIPVAVYIFFVFFVPQDGTSHWILNLRVGIDVVATYLLIFLSYIVYRIESRRDEVTEFVTREEKWEDRRSKIILYISDIGRLIRDLEKDLNKNIRVPDNLIKDYGRKIQERYISLHQDLKKFRDLEDDPDSKESIESLLTQVMDNLEIPSKVSSFIKNETRLKEELSTLVQSYDKLYENVINYFVERL